MEPPHHTGTSEGGDMTTVIEALEWYKEKAIAMALKLAKFKDGDTSYVLAVLTELSLDAGKRGESALAQAKLDAAFMDAFREWNTNRDDALNELFFSHMIAAWQSREAG